MKISALARAQLALILIGCSGSTPAPSAPAAGTSATSAAAPPLAVSATAGSVAAKAAAGAPAAVSAPAASGATLAQPPLEPGYMRFTPPPVNVPAGTSDDWMQWVGGPTDQDYDVSSIKGAQSKIGHHALMLTTTAANPVGFTRIWNERDQLTSSSMGGIGAEGAIPLPEGVAIRIKKGTYFVIQTHYLNATDKDAMGETYIDVKLEQPNPAHKLAGHFASTSLSIMLPPKAMSSMDIHCKTERDLPLLRMTNHMHHFGVNVFTEMTDPSGKTTMLKRDDAWSEHWALAPNFDYFTVDKPLMIPSGSTVHTRCTWNNDTDKPVMFPGEMCVFATLVLGDMDISCLDGKFQVSNTEQAAAPAAGTSGSAGSPTTGAAGAPAAAGGGACSGADKSVLDGPDFQNTLKNCATMCLGDTDTCTTGCLMKNTTLTAGCAACNGTRTTCAMQHCISDCTAGFMSPGCSSCIETNCGAAYHTCSSL